MNLEKNPQELCVTAKASSVIMRDIFNGNIDLVGMTREVTSREKPNRCKDVWCMLDSQCC